MIVDAKYNGLWLSVWAPSYEEVRQKVGRKKFLIYANHDGVPDGPLKDDWEEVKSEEEYVDYLVGVAQILAREGLLVGGRDGEPRVGLKIYCGGLVFEGGVIAEETIAPLRIQAGKWKADGEVVARLGDPVGIFVGHYNPGWEWRNLPKWRKIKEVILEQVESMKEVCKGAEKLLREVVEELKPGDYYAIVSYIPHRLDGGMYFFHPSSPCTVAEAEMTYKEE